MSRPIPPIPLLTRRELSAERLLLTVLIEAGRMVLGRWQGIYFCEFDGPRERKMQVKVVAFEVGKAPQ